MMEFIDHQQMVDYVVALREFMAQDLGVEEYQEQLILLEAARRDVEGELLMNYVSSNVKSEKEESDDYEADYIG